MKHIAISTSFILALFFIFNIYQGDVETRITKEVQYNHAKKMPSEVLTDDYLVINEALDRLNFEVKQSTILPGTIQLVGARYCSIQGKIAAQIQLENSINGKRYTLYQFRLSGQKVIPKESEINHKGVIVKIWKEGDLGFALAVDE